MRGTVLTPGQRGPTFIGKARLRPAGRTEPARAHDGLHLQVRQGDEQHAVWRRPRRVALLLRDGEHGGDRVRAVHSGLINPGFRNSVTAMQFNPFVKFRGLEFFGVVERAEGGGRGGD